MITAERGWPPPFFRLTNGRILPRQAPQGFASKQVVHSSHLFVMDLSGDIRQPYVAFVFHGQVIVLYEILSLAVFFAKDDAKPAAALFRRGARV